MIETYQEFLRKKLCLAENFGFEVDEAEINPIAKPHQKDLIRWAVKGGRRAIFADFGLGKTLIQLEALRIVLAKMGQGRALIIAPLGVRQEFFRDAEEKLNISIRFVRRIEETEPTGLYITNYETVRDGKLDPNQFAAVSLDEASVLRSYGSKTYQTFLTLFQKVRFKFVATATPAPNRYKELIHYAGYLGIMDTGQALTRFFQRDSTKANNLTLYKHKEAEFWLWLSSWAVFATKPSDLCRCVCHEENNLKKNDSDFSSLNHGFQVSKTVAHGSAGVTVEEQDSQRQTISPTGKTQVAGANDQSTAEKAQSSLPSGRRCLIDADDLKIKTGRITEGAESPSASDGASSRISDPTWANRQTVRHSTELTTTEIMNLEIADGRAVLTKQETAELDAKKQNQGEKGWCNSCRCDDGYELPPLKVYYHEISSDHATAGMDKFNHGLLFRDASRSLKAAAKERRDTLKARAEKMSEIIEANPDDHFLIWHDLEAERHAIKKALPEAVEVYGSQDLEIREQNVIDFSDGKIKYLATKPILSGSGCNFQRHCHKAIFFGVGYKFNNFVQSIHRIQRFLQDKPCEIHVIYADSEKPILRTLQQKWERHNQMIDKMSGIIRERGLANAGLDEALKRSLGCERIEVQGENFTAVNNDCVEECGRIQSDSIDMILTSIPFSNHYEYTPSYNDFGHTEGDDHFFAQMDFLTPELLRILRPGRVAAIHVKDRINFGNVTGYGMPTSNPFHAKTIFHYLKHGFVYMGMITVVTDVVRENNQTYRLGWTENCKDGTKMGVGSPEYVLLFRKLPSDTSDGFGDVPVVKSKAEYSRSRWQIDAHAFWRSSGNRILTPEELSQIGPDILAKLFTEQSLQDVYDYESHVKIGEALDIRGALPTTFMALAPGSHCKDVWHNIARMLTLNSEQSRRQLEMHVCPLQFDIVERLIIRYTNEDDLVFDPFAGLMTVPLIANKINRKGYGVELNPQYFLDGLVYLKAWEKESRMPTLFDLEKAEQVAAQ